jgi:hypothetical protein
MFKQDLASELKSISIPPHIAVKNAWNRKKRKEGASLRQTAARITYCPFSGAVGDISHAMLQTDQSHVLLLKGTYDLLPLQSPLQLTRPPKSHVVAGDHVENRGAIPSALARR